MEKRKPHYSLREIQEQMTDVPSLGLTQSATDSILFDLRWELEDALHVVQYLRPGNFYKSMTTVRNHRVWQDVYHAVWCGIKVYVKFQRQDDLYFFTVSFKEL